MFKNFGKPALGVLLAASFVTACSGGGGTAAENKQGTAAAANQPITLTIFNVQPAGVDFEKLGIVQAIQQKFPYITVKLINRQKGSEYADMVASETPIDIIYDSTAFTVSNIKTFGYAYDLQELIKKYNFDLKVFEPNVLAHALSTNAEGKLYGLPFTMNKYALYYNKNLFDRFGIPYPKDGMTWDEVYDLAKKMTRVDNGVTYYGFTAVPNNLLLNNQLSLSPLDPKEDKASVNTDAWKRVFDNVRRFAEIPNNAFVPVNEAWKGTVAMVLDPGSITNAPEDVQWDLASLPELPEKPKTGFKPASLSLFLSQTSKYKDDAFKVMAYLVSEEAQTMLAKQAVATPLANQQVKKMFGQDLPKWKGKNVGALYYYQDAPASAARADNLTNVGVNFSALFTKKQDSNTILRDFDEEINKAIQTEKLKKQTK